MTQCDAKREWLCLVESTLWNPPKNSVDQIQSQCQMSPSTPVKNYETLHPSREGNTIIDINMELQSRWELQEEEGGEGGGGGGQGGGEGGCP